MWKPISSLTDGVLYRGDRLRVELQKENDAEDQYVDFMFFNDLSGAKGLSLIRLTGYCAGNISTTFPPESVPEGHNGTSISWLKSNWKLWVSGSGRPLRLWVDSNLPRVRKPPKR
jgi:hypothetical protein